MSTQADTTALRAALDTISTAWRREFARCARRRGLTAALASTLATVVTGPLTMSSLAASLGCNASNVTHLVARLEDRGLVRLDQSHADRRVKYITATDAGHRVHREIDKEVACAQRCLDVISHDERAQLLCLLTRVREALEHP